MSKIIVTPLGTVSPYTKGDMNCPGYLVEYNNKKILLDCGNGISRLLDFPSIMNDLSIIITHYHKDHYGDLSVMQYASFSYHNLGLLNNKINVYIPKNEIVHNREAILTTEEGFINYYDIDDNYSFDIDDLHISFHNNKSHVIESYMVILENSDTKIVYTSDVGPTNFDDLVEFSKDADLLICESSFLLKHNAHSKYHLTANDAGLLAKKADVKKLVLTHFWPDEDKNNYLEEAKEVFENTEVAIEGNKIIIER